MKKILEGSRAIAETINNVRPMVVSAFPITPQTHIVEDLAKFKADGEASYEYVRTESEFAALSVLIGASAAGVRTYTATSSQGLLLMTEVIFNVAGMRLPIVMTDANRAISAPINIWCFSKDAQVLMADLTYKPINKIKIGDAVLGKDNRGNLVYTNVKKLYSRFADDLVRLRSDKFDLLCTPEHRFYYRNGHDHWTEAKKLKNKNLHWLGYGFDNNDEYKRGWLTGVSDGDGCFFKDKQNRFKFSLKVKDEEMVDNFILWSNYFGFPLRKATYMEKEGYYIAVITSNSRGKEFESFLNKNNCTNDFRRGYLAGMYDAEGTGPFKVKQAVIYNNNKELIKFISDSLKLLDISFKVYVDTRRGGFHINDNYHVKINNVPEFFIRCRPIISRKRDNLLRMTLKSVKSRVKIDEVIEVHQKTKVYNIETGTNNYIVNGLLAHNCDQQDAVTMRDAGWIMLYGEDNQETCDLHILAFKVAEQLEIPVMVNVDGFILTHVVEPVEIETPEKIKKYLPAFAPKEKLDINHPLTFGAFATPKHYFEIRKELHDDLSASVKTLEIEMKNFGKHFGRALSLAEYFGDKNADTVIIAMGSVLGTIREAADELRQKGSKVGILKISSLRPFPDELITKLLSGAKNIAVVDKSISLGTEGIIATEVRRALNGQGKNISSFIVGLGGRDITKDMIKKIYKSASGKNAKAVFVGE